jgi:hypothetical protein
MQPEDQDRAYAGYGTYADRRAILLREAPPRSALELQRQHETKEVVQRLIALFAEVNK